MATKVAEKTTVSTRLIGRWQQVCRKFIALAEEVPEKKFNYTPMDGTRSIADVLRHVAFWNFYVADSARGKKADDSANELSKEKYASKTQIVDALKRSASDATAALEEIPSALSPETAEMLVTFIEHTSEHYGQLVVYARLNGIVPPASRG